MMSKLIARVPLNSTSLGNVSINILKDLYEKNFDVAIFPHQDTADLSVFDKISSDFSDWVSSGIKDRYKIIQKDIPTLQVWHLHNSIARFSSKSFLYTFYELDKPTSSEIKTCHSHDKVIFSSSDACRVFTEAGAKNVNFSPLGYDKDFFETGKSYLNPKTIHFGLMGKLEKRKHTLRILKLWAEQYGNKPNYELSCAITNKFISAEDLNKQIGESLNHKYYQNINFIPFMKTNSEMNDFMNAIDIDLTGLSGGEGWNLPSFNSTCLGKWSCVLNATSHKDWATKENSILIEPNGKEEVYDNIFFKEGYEFNQGSINTFSSESFLQATEKAIHLSKTENKEGKKLKEKFSYKNCVDKILSNIF